MANKICAAFKQKKNPTSNEVGFGARYRTRTCDPMHVKHVLYQLS